MRSLVLVLFAAGCLQSGVVVCDFGTCPPDSVCDTVHDRCVAPSQLETCKGVDNGMPCTVANTDDGVCHSEVCLVAGCGDGVIRGPEQCDPLAELPAGTTCKTLNFYKDGEVSCNEDCTFDVTACSQRCGDEVLQPEFEICEAGVEPNRTCIDYGYGAGVLTCVNCGPGTEDCIPFGWQLTPTSSAAWEIQGHADNDVYAVLQNPFGVLHYNGTSWSPLDVSTCNVPSTAYIQQLWTPAPGVVFAGGDNMVIRLEGTTCTTWTIPGAYVADVWASSATDVWALALDGVYHLEGASFMKSVGTPGTTGSNENVLAIWGTSSTNLYALGDNNGVAAVWHYTGSWSSPTALPSIDGANAIWGTSATDIYVGGVDNSLGAVALRYDGTTWTRILGSASLFSSSNSYVYRGWTAGGRVFVSTGDPGSADPYPTLVNEGTGWVHLDAPTTTPQPLWASDTGRAFMAPSSFPKIAMLDGTVRVDRSPGLNAEAEGLVARTAERAYAYVQQVGIYDWSGSTWQLVSNTDDVVDLERAASGAVFAIGANGFRKNTNGTWTNDASLQAVGEDALFPLAADDVWVLESGGTGKVKRWRSAGNVTVVPDYPTTEMETMYDLWVASPTDAILVGTRRDPVADTDVGHILRFNGSAWSPVTVPAGIKYITRLWGRSITDLYALAETTLLHFDGTTWSKVMLPSSTTITDVWGTATETFVGTVDGLYYNDGTRWSPVDVGALVGVARITGAGSVIMFLDRLGGWHRLVRLAPW